MFILPQILKISSKNLLVNQLTYTLKNKLLALIEQFTTDTTKNR